MTLLLKEYNAIFIINQYLIDFIALLNAVRSEPACRQAGVAAERERNRSKSGDGAVHRIDAFALRGRQLFAISCGL